MSDKITDNEFAKRYYSEHVTAEVTFHCKQFGEAGKPARLAGLRGRVLLDAFDAASRMSGAYLFHVVYAGDKHGTTYSADYGTCVGSHHRPLREVAALMRELAAEELTDALSPRERLVTALCEAEGRALDVDVAVGIVGGEQALAAILDQRGDDNDTKVYLAETCDHRVRVRMRPGRRRKVPPTNRNRKSK